jgi:hypothetical protein
MSNTKKDVNLTNILLVIFSILIVVLFLFNGNKMNDNLETFKKEYNEKYVRLLNVKTNLIDIKKLNYKDSIILIKKNDLIEINKNINSLAEEVFNERNRAETIIDKDIDRLNLYMAVGIGFMALIGIFLPILVNLISIQDLKEKQKNLENRIDDTNIDEAKKKIASIESDLNTHLPSISTLYIQNSLSRYFNISPILLTNLIRQRDKSYFIEILENIKIGFKKCNEDQRHIIKNDKFLISTLNDFVYFLEKPSSHSSFFNKEIQIAYENLRVHLITFIDSDKEDENAFYSGVEEKISQIINLINTKDSKKTPS